MNITAVATATDTPEERYVSVSVRPRLKFSNFIWGIIGIVAGILAVIDNVYDSVLLATLGISYNRLWVVVYIIPIIVGVWYLTRSVFCVWETYDIEKDLNTDGVFVLQALSR